MQFLAEAVTLSLIGGVIGVRRRPGSRERRRARSCDGLPTCRSPPSCWPSSSPASSGCSSVCIRRARPRARSDRRAEIRVAVVPISTCFRLALARFTATACVRRSRCWASRSVLRLSSRWWRSRNRRARMSIEQHVKAAGTNQITVVAGNYSGLPSDLGSDVLEGGGEAADESLGGLAGGSGTSTSPRSAGARKEEGWWPGRGISPRLPGRGAARRCRSRTPSDRARSPRCELSSARRLGHGGHSRRRYHALRAAAGYRHRHDVDQGSHAGGRPVLHAGARRRPRESRRAVIERER